MTAMPRELAHRRPAEVTSVSASPRTIDGRFRAVHGGPSLRGVLTAFLFLILAFGFAGFLLSSL